MSTLELLGLESPGWGGALLWGAVSTLKIATAAYVIGIALGFVGAMMKLSGVRPLAWTAEAYTTILRAVPELLLIILLFFAGADGLNRLFTWMGWAGKFDIDGTLVAIGVLGVVTSAYSTEVIRGAILSIPAGQIEASRAFGMSTFLTFRRVILPCMLPAALPGLGNLWMIAVKDTSLVSVVGTTELVTVTKQAAGSTRAYFLFYLACAAIYLVITLISNRGFRFLEARAGVGTIRSRGGVK